MAIPQINKEHIEGALKYIDENGIPSQNKSTKYELVTEDGKKYPPKYVVAAAAHLASGTDISTDGYNAVEAKNFLQGQGYTIESKLIKFELTITSDSVISTDERFTMDDISLGDNYKPLKAYFQTADDVVVNRDYAKGEKRNSNQTMPRLACQIYEKQLSALSTEQKESFPVCKYNPESELICGIYTSVEDFREHRKTIEYLVYNYAGDRQFVIYCWNVFSTILFVQECLKRFGNPGDKMVLTYREKDEMEEEEADAEFAVKEELVQGFKGYRNPYSSMLIESKNLIFHGAPGTGKSYLAREIAADIISNGYYDKYTQLSDEQKKQVEFVQFHPSFDYTDFVEGLRPKLNQDGSIGFDLQDGIFKKFITEARKNYEDSQKSTDVLEREMSVQEAMSAFFDSIKYDETAKNDGNDFKTISGSKFKITGVDDKHINITIPGNDKVKNLILSIAEIRAMLESDVKFTQIKDITKFFGKRYATQGYSYNFAIYNEIKKTLSGAKVEAKPTELKKYIFIIDEINRGEISKIFGELFFAIDPGYRGKAGEISTQYSNIHDKPDEKFYIPENVYIIGTMNDIDRSVDSFDFAMRRRFRFVEIKADDRLEMLDNLEDDAKKAEAIKRMSALNKEIAAVEELNENYQIGAAYFLKLKNLNFDQLWTDYLKPLLQEYIQGMYALCDGCPCFWCNDWNRRQCNYLCAVG